MNHADYQKVTEEFLAVLTTIGATKGKEYANDEDRLANFKRIGEKLGIEPETVLMVYMTKHWESVNVFVKGLQSGANLSMVEQGMSEPIKGRIHDLVNYGLLLNALIEDRRRQTT